MIIALCGYAMSGKDTVANMVKEIDNSYRIKKFSGKLKIIASLLTGIPPENFESQNFKTTELPGWDTWGYKSRNDGDSLFPKYTGEPYRKSMTVRELLQKLGTDAIRDGLHEDAWVNALFCDYHKDDNWVISDCRFKNEAKAVKEFGGYVVRVSRDGYGPVNGHISETEMDDWGYDFELKNGTLEQLRIDVDYMLSMFNKKKGNYHQTSFSPDDN